MIGQTLPMDNIVSGINTAAPLVSREGHADAAEAIMTTDTFVKEAAVTVTLGGVDVPSAGWPKAPA